jgi:hypothetical protein
MLPPHNCAQWSEMWTVIKLRDLVSTLYRQTVLLYRLGVKKILALLSPHVQLRHESSANRPACSYTTHLWRISFSATAVGELELNWGNTNQSSLSASFSGAVIKGSYKASWPLSAGSYNFTALNGGHRPLYKYNAVWEPWRSLNAETLGALSGLHRL